MTKPSEDTTRLQEQLHPIKELGRRLLHELTGHYKTEFHSLADVITPRAGEKRGQHIKRVIEYRGENSLLQLPTSITTAEEIELCTDPKELDLHIGNLWLSLNAIKSKQPDKTEQLFASSQTAVVLVAFDLKAVGGDTFTEIDKIADDIGVSMTSLLCNTSIGDLNPDGRNDQIRNSASLMGCYEQEQTDALTSRIEIYADDAGTNPLLQTAALRISVSTFTPRERSTFRPQAI